MRNTNPIETSEAVAPCAQTFQQSAIVSAPSAGAHLGRGNGAKSFLIAQAFDTGGSLVYERYPKIPDKNQAPDRYKAVRAELRKEETLLSTGNGYMVVRGASCECPVSEHEPSASGTYIAGVYNRQTSTVEGGRQAVNEDMVNITNFLELTWRVDGGAWFDPNKATILESKRELTFLDGSVLHQYLVEDESGRQTKVTARRLVSMADKHLASLEYNITPVNYSGEIEVRQALDATHKNCGVDRYLGLKRQHLEPVSQESQGLRAAVVAKTTQSKIRIATVSESAVFLNGETLVPGNLTNDTDEGRAEIRFRNMVGPGQTLTVEKKVAVHTSRDHDSSQPLADADRTLAACRDRRFADSLKASAEVWAQKWADADVRVYGDNDSQMLLRLHSFHILANAPYAKEQDVSMGPRGLTGESYRGLIFWDTLYMMPYLCAVSPEAAKAVIMYRFNRLRSAIDYARANHYVGAMWPWNSGSEGEEMTQRVKLNPTSMAWDPDNSRLQRHVGLAVAYETWLYSQITGDREFMDNHGAEILFHTARFWASPKLGQKDDAGRYHITGVMGPDEFHETYPPGNPNGGLDDNAYTNTMVAWLMKTAIEVHQRMGHDALVRLSKKMLLQVDEIGRWAEMARNMNLEMIKVGANGNGPVEVVEQFRGWGDLRPISKKDLEDELQKAHGRGQALDKTDVTEHDLARVDRFLKAIGLSPDAFQTAKQADALMAPFVLGKVLTEDVMQNQLGYPLAQGWLRHAFDYYISRCTHGSTLSRLVYGALATKLGDAQYGWRMYKEALESDLKDIQGGTTAEGIHSGVMAGTVWMAMNSFGGVNLTGEKVTFNPNLPKQWEKVEFGFSFRGDRYECEIAHQKLAVTVYTDKPFVEAEIQGKPVTLARMERFECELAPVQ